MAFGCRWMSKLAYQNRSLLSNGNRVHRSPSLPIPRARYFLSWNPQRLQSFMLSIFTNRLGVLQKALLGYSDGAASWQQFRLTAELRQSGSKTSERVYHLDGSKWQIQVEICFLRGNCCSTITWSHFHPFLPLFATISNAICHFIFFDAFFSHYKVPFPGKMLSG